MENQIQHRVRTRRRRATFVHQTKSLFKNKKPKWWFLTFTLIIGLYLNSEAYFNKAKAGVVTIPQRNPGAIICCLATLWCDADVL